MAGLLDLFGQRDPNDPVNMGLLGMSAALGTPVRQGGGVGPAFGAFGQGFQNSQQAEMRRRVMESQIEENKRKEMPAPKSRFIPLANGNIFDTETQSFKQAPQSEKPEKAHAPSPEMQLINALYPDPADPNRAKAIKDLLQKKSEYAPPANIFNLQPFQNPAGANLPPVLQPFNARTGTVGPVVGTAPPSTSTLKAGAEAKSAAGKLEMLDAQIAQAEELLPKATASGAGAIVDKATQFVGMDTPSNTAAAQLETIGAWMMANVPRFRGQDSNRDVALYQQMAANVGDRTKPVRSRLAALKTLKDLRRKAVIEDPAQTDQPSNQPAPDRRRYNPKTGEFE